MMRTPLIGLLLASCAAPDTGQMFNDIDLSILSTAEEVNDRFIDVANGADERLSLALPGLLDPELAIALVEAFDRGVEVKVVVDIDLSDNEPTDTLRDAGVPLRLADGDLTYFEFQLNADVRWSSTQVQMTHAFVVGDLGELVMASSGGDLTDRATVMWSGYSEELAEDLRTEHVQIFGGSDATALTAFDAMAKSIADPRWAYPTTSDEIFQLWLGPQERVTKRMIDAVYGARGPIRVLTEDFADEGMARALQQKAADGFDVEVIVGRSFGLTNPSLSDILLQQAPDVSVLQSTDTRPLPTLVFVDLGRGLDGRFHQPRVMVGTHPIWSAARLFNDVEVVTDQLCDGALYVLGVDGQPTAPLQELSNIYRDVRVFTEAL